MNKRERAAKAIEEFLDALGYRSEGELVGTGERVADAWIDELVSGEHIDPVALLEEGSLDLGPGPHGVVVLRKLAVAAMCPHHLLPSLGEATVGYVPRRRAAGLGAIAKVVEVCSRRLVLQERLGVHIASALSEGLDAEGAFCRLRLTHTCFSVRGERQSEAIVETLSTTGSFDRDGGALAVALCRE